MMKRRDFLRSVGVATVAVGAAGALRAESKQNPFAAEGKERPNILFLFTDDQCFRTIGSLNNKEVKTPNIDRLVKRGTTFTHCFNQGSFSGAVCLCSRAMVQTGRYLWQTTGGDCKGLPLWGETMGKAGYETFMTGKWHNGEDAHARSFKHKGDLGGGMYQSRPPKDSNANPYSRDKQGDAPGAKNKWTPWDPAFTGHWLKRDGKVIHSSDLWGNESLEFLNTVGTKSDNPFMMYVAFHAPHDPRQAPKEYVDMYPQKDVNVPSNYAPEHPFDQGDHKLRDERLAPFPRSKECVQLHRQEYYAIITHADKQIGRILDALDKSGKADNTIIIFSADHGLAVGEHGLMGKQNMYDHSVRMPFIIAGPGIEKDVRNSAMIYMQSIFATTCEMTGVKAPDGLQFPSLVPLLTGEKTKLYDDVYGAYKTLQRMVRTEQYKLIRYPHAKEVQLFDIAADPFETKDLAEDPKFAATVADMDKRLVKWMKLTGDNQFVSNDDPTNLVPRKAGKAPKKTKAKNKSNKSNKSSKPNKSAGQIVCSPDAATCTGMTYQRDKSNIGAWKDPKGTAVWTITVPETGNYTVTLNYGAGSAGRGFVITAGDASVDGVTVKTGKSMRNPKAVKLGTLELVKGKQTLTLSAKPFKDGAIMNIYGVTLTPVKK
ncbi:MAG: sulfatase-like hydrolase/transferase [Phycisphaerales bacterium]|jgi:arylsulfatase A-like enzyme|nr:sulfatase-like hydrolase/transferase [Phycisphaerales bacterium]MBT7171409.1 sulfatase-like hydrolase/transferase [Phycisphaerales bacterium]